jgi:hypothetical protein
MLNSLAGIWYSFTDDQLPRKAKGGWNISRNEVICIM